MRRAAAWLLGGFAALRFLRRRPKPASDPRADELRARLVEARELVDERDEFEAGETTIDEAEPPEDPETRRRAVHDAGREIVDRMRTGRTKP